MELEASRFNLADQEIDRGRLWKARDRLNGLLADWPRTPKTAVKPPTPVGLGRVGAWIGGFVILLLLVSLAVGIVTIGAWFLNLIGLFL
jgi:hypothetical protein